MLSARRTSTRKAGLSSGKGSTLSSKNALLGARSAQNTRRVKRKSAYEQEEEEDKTNRAKRPKDLPTPDLSENHERTPAASVKHRSTPSQPKFALNRPPIERLNI